MDVKMQNLFWHMAECMYSILAVLIKWSIFFIPFVICLKNLQGYTKLLTVYWSLHLQYFERRLI